MTLLDECLIILGDKAKVLNNTETNQIIEAFFKIFPITNFGRINWDRLEIKAEVLGSDNVFDELKIILGKKNIPTDVFLLWNEAGLPVIKSTLGTILQNLDDVTPVGIDTFLWAPGSYVIEFYHEGDINVGREPDIKKRLSNLIVELAHNGIDIDSLPTEFHFLANHIRRTNNEVQKIATELLNDEVLEENEISLLKRQNLFSSAWLGPEGRKIPLIKIPAVLEYAKNIEKLRSLCAIEEIHQRVLKKFSDMIQ